MKAVVMRGPNDIQLEERAVPIPNPGEVVVRTAFASICHTDFITMAGEFPNTKLPTVLGHEFSGVVESCGSLVSHVAPGDRVTAMSYSFCGVCPACRRGVHIGCPNISGMPFSMDGAFQEMVLVPANIVFPVADSFSLDEAALTEPAANGYSAADRAGIYPGEHVVIIGPGPIGLLAMQFAALKNPGSLIMLGTRSERLNLAAKQGATHTINVREQEPYEAVQEITKRVGADAVLFCGGGEDAWELASRMLAPNGRVLIEALPSRSAERWSVPVFDFTAKQISYIGVSGYNAAQFSTTLQLMQAHKVDVKSLITHKFPLEAYKEAFETCENRIGGAIKVEFDMGIVE